MKRPLCFGRDPQTLLPAQRKHLDKEYDVAVLTRPVHDRSAHGEQRLKGPGRRSCLVCAGSKERERDNTAV